MKDFDLRKYLAEGRLLKEDISSHKKEAKRFLEKFIDDNKDEFEFIPDLETGYIDAKDNSYNVDELASIFLDIGQDIPRGKYNQKYKGEGGTYVVVAENKLLKEDLIDKIKKLKDYNKTEDSLKYKKYDITYDKDENLYSVFLKKGSGDSSDMPEFESNNPEKVKKYLAEGKLLKEDQMMGKYIETTHPDGYDMIMSFSMPDEGELGLDYGTLDEILEVKEIDGVKVYCVYI